MPLALKYKPIRIQSLKPYFEAIFLTSIWLLYFASINVRWTEGWIAESFLPDSVAPHYAIAFPAIFFVNVFWLIPRYLNKRKWHVYLFISSGLFITYEVLRAFIFSWTLPTQSFVQELTGENGLALGKLNFITTNAIFWSFIYRFTRDWIINQSVISSLQIENTHLKTSLLTEKKVKPYREVFTVKKNDNKLLLQIESVIYFKAQGDFVLAIDAHGKKYIINNSLKNIIKEIDSKQFFQINRSEIVNRTFIKKFSTYIKNRLEITLKESDDVLFTSNSRTPKFRIWISKN